MHEATGHLISAVTGGSIAAELGIEPGDRLLAIDGQAVIDVFDYRTRQITQRLVLLVEAENGGEVELDIEKDEYEDLGLEFANPVMTDCAGCENHCVFCFIDQLPKGLRPSLYFKDDDIRLSFLTGNYVTLTNIDDAELNRLIEYRLSPINLSVHTTDPQLRLRMMRHQQAGNILERMRRIAAAGIMMNVQIVLCPGLNDGQALQQTLDDLLMLGPVIQSIAIVPVGLTRYRSENRLFPLRPLDAPGAAWLIAEINKRQVSLLAERQVRLVYAADEIYLKAGIDLPPATEYDDFPQLENGVGMGSLFRAELAAGLAGSTVEPVAPLWSAYPQLQPIESPQLAILVSGTAAAPLLKPWLPALTAKFGIKLALAEIVNRFLGETITVAGLLTGQDIIAQTIEKIETFTDFDRSSTCMILPGCLLKAGEDILLDDCTVKFIAESLQLPVHVCSADAAGLLGLLAQLPERSVT